MQVAHPLHKLTSGENVGKKKATIKWDSKCQHAFDDLKTPCTTAPILAYADFTKPFKLHNDACGTGLGAVLYQTQEDGTEAVIAYASRSLNIAESHYPAYKLEFLALKWAGSRNSMNTCMGQPSMCTPTIIHSPITDYSQAGFSHPSLGSQFGKLQFQVALSGRQNQHQCQCSI